MPIGELAMHYALKNHILQLQYNWIILKPKNRPKIKVQDPSYTVKILVPDSATGFAQFVPQNTNRFATLSENPTNCKQNVYFQFGLTVMTIELSHAVLWTAPGLHRMWPVDHMRQRACYKSIHCGYI